MSATKRRMAIPSKDLILSCRHESLRLPSIAIAERCPRCRMWVIPDGRTFEQASEAIAVRSAKAA